MKKHLSRTPATALALLATAVAATLLAVVDRGPQVCRLQVIPDYDFIVAYRAVLRLSPQCGFTQTLRVRKSSTLNTRRAGARYQPVEPRVGAWTLGRLKTTVPRSALWTSPSWRWEYNDAVLTKSRWVAGEVLSAGPDNEGRD